MAGKEFLLRKNRRNKVESVKRKIFGNFSEARIADASLQTLQMNVVKVFRSYIARTMSRRQ